MSTGSAIEFLKRNLLLLLSAMTLLISVANLATIAFRPIYPDEISYIVQNSRAFENGLRSTPQLMAECQKTDRIVAPLTWIPGHVLDSLILGSSRTPIGIRMVGVLLFLLAMFAFYLISSTALSFASPLVRSGVIASVFFSGLLPYMLVMTRPETQILLCVCFFVSAPRLYRLGSQRCSLCATWLVVSAFVLATSLILFIHPKGMFFVPLVVVSLLATFWKNHRSLALISSVLFLVVATQSFFVHSLRLQCYEAQAAFQSLARGQQLVPAMLFTEPAKFFHEALVNIIRSRMYVANLHFAQNFAAAWMPPTDHVRALGEMANLLTSLGWAAVLLLFLALSLKSIKRALRDRLISEPAWISMSLFVALVSLAAVQVEKHFYESSLVLPLTFLLVLMLSKDIALSPRWENARRILWITLMFAASASQAYALYQYQGWWNSDIEAVGIPVLASKSFDFNDLTTRIEKLERDCHLQDQKDLQNLFVDDWTYLPLADSFRPRLVTLSHLLALKDGDPEFDKLPELMRKISSSGYLLHCSELPPRLRSIGVREGDLCCIRGNSLP